MKVIRDFLAGSYSAPAKNDDPLDFGDEPQDIALQIGQAIVRYREQCSLHLPERCAATDPARIVEAAIMSALNQRRSAAVLADSGCGKTTAARIVAIREPDVVFIPCDCHDFRQLAFLARLTDALGTEKHDYRSVWHLQRAIVDVLKGTNLVLVIDDAHYLINPNKPSRSAALDVVKDLQTHAETPFVLLGVPELWATINKRSTGGWFDQLLGRISMHHTIRCDMIREDDVASVAVSFGVGRATHFAFVAISRLTRSQRRRRVFPDSIRRRRWLRVKRRAAQSASRNPSACLAPAPS